ncbi:MAG: SIMPL domain-containing protein [Planctomycetota bacterium]|nr:SIMPL domain-containing protein [Planctomycetota bacterium]
MNKTTMFCVIGMSLILVGMIAVRGQSAPENAPATPQRTIIATGTGSMPARPDSVRVHLGIVTQAKTVAEARDENAKTVAQIQLAIVALELGDLKAKTQNSSVRIVNRKAADEPRIEVAGYEVSQSFTVVFQSSDVEELATAGGKILEAGLLNGANTQGDVKFFLADDSELVRQVKSIAVEDALANAQALAAGAGVKIVEVIQIDNVEGDGSWFGGGGGGQQGVGFERGARSGGLFVGELHVATSVKIVCRY